MNLSATPKGATINTELDRFCFLDLDMQLN